MARPRKHDGVVYRRNDSNVWWMRYREKDGSRRLESTNTTDWDEAQRQLRERLTARDNNGLETLRKGKQVTALKTHEANENALKTLRPAFGTSRLPEIDPTQIESHLRARLQQKASGAPKGRNG